MSHSGGISEARKIAAMGEAHHQELATHYTGSPLNTAATLHLNMAIPNCGVQEYGVAAGPPEPLLAITPGAFLAGDGYLTPTNKPGLGLDFNESAALSAQARLKDRPQSALRDLRRPDGWVSNW